MNLAHEALGRIPAGFRWCQHSWRQKVRIKCSVWGVESFFFLFFFEISCHSSEITCYNINTFYFPSCWERERFFWTWHVNQSFFSACFWIICLSDLINEPFLPLESYQIPCSFDIALILMNVMFKSPSILSYSPEGSSRQCSPSSVNLSTVITPADISRGWIWCEDPF